MLAWCVGYNAVLVAPLNVHRVDLAESLFVPVYQKVRFPLGQRVMLVS